MKTPTMLIAVGIAVSIGGALLIAYWYSHTPVNPVLAEAIERVQDIEVYTQEDMTETVISGRTLLIEGIYHNDHRSLRYLSSATTTVTIPGEPDAHSFNLSNISLGDNVYTKIETGSPLLRGQIPQAEGWQHFRRDAIPAAFANIAVSGPILDHLRLFEQKGAYMTLVDDGIEEEVGGETLLSFTMKLSEKAKSPLGGTLATLVERIGEGTVRVSVHEPSREIRRIVITNGSFHATTSISALGIPLDIKPPVE